MAPKTVEELVKRIDQIPTLPMVSSQIMRLLEDENVSINKLSELIEKDQALAVKILKVANSSFYGSFSQTSSIDYAIMKLGLGEVKAILHAFSIHSFFSQKSPAGFDRAQFWKHAIICSQIARYLGTYFNMGKDDTLFLSGLIHDLGKIIFDQYFHDDFLQIIQLVNDHHESFSKAEKTVLGFTHYQVAAKLLQKWQFPKKIIMQVFYHHAPWNDANFSAGSIVIYLANILTKLAGYPCLESERPPDLNEFADSNAMAHIVKSGFDLDRASLETLVNNIREFISGESENMLRFF
ncbi:MAG: HDOD domain-containing protein [Thermodesulfobacteriota bacterium]